MKVSYFIEDIKHWGQYSGYLRLPEYISRIEPEIRFFQFSPGNRLFNLLGRFAGRNGKRPRKENYRNFFEWYFYYVYTRRLAPGSIYHFLNFDSTYPFLDRIDEVPRRLIFTLHNPDLSGMTAEYKKYLSRVSSAIVLYRRDIEWFESFVGRGRVKFAPHGVDTEFFRPKPMTSFPKNPRILFVGRIYRNTALLARLVEEISSKMPEVRFDLLVTPFQLSRDPHIKRISGLQPVQVHSGVSDSALRQLYQESYLMLMPLIDSGANTALVEALSSGLPVVTHDVGGVPDYGGGAVFPTVLREDEEGMQTLIEQYLSDFKWRNEIAAAGRDFAVSHLAWPIVARKHCEIYEALCL